MPTLPLPRLPPPSTLPLKLCKARLIKQARRETSVCHVPLPSSHIHLLTYNQEVAKDDSQDVSTRAGAAKDAVSDKAGEVKHSVRGPLSYPP